MEALGAKHQKDHEPVVVGACLGNATLLPHQRPAAITAYNVLGMQNSAITLLTLGDDHMHAIMVLVYLLGTPPIQHADFRDLGSTRPEHCLCCVLRQSFVIGEIEWSYELPLKPVVGIAPQQAPVRRQAPDAVFA